MIGLIALRFYRVKVLLIVLLCRKKIKSLAVLLGIRVLGIESRLPRFPINKHKLVTALLETIKSV